ncbi:MAG: TIGR04563 family protein [Deltaproteobacteria bacterium]|nr:TIGR04563 family protein [Sandaracinaceae bacterium]MCX7807411.1 TIGR04563 family protein [Deltaproteobacteria bacterium]MDW8245270.1 TIGR04563 family protein [Sandaracinaceae bacterium]
MTESTRNPKSNAPTDPRKISVYLPLDIINELRREALRLDRTISWIIQRCVRIGIHEIRKMPTVNDLEVVDFRGQEDQGNDTKSEQNDGKSGI